MPCLDWEWDWGEGKRQELKPPEPRSLGGSVQPVLQLREEGAARGYVAPGTERGVETL